MKTEDFYNLVMEMRKAQRYYFASRNRSALITSKNLEHLVDVELNKVFNKDCF